jgi:hypothetical protein
MAGKLSCLRLRVCHSSSLEAADSATAVAVAPEVTHSHAARPVENIYQAVLIAPQPRMIGVSFNRQWCTALLGRKVGTTD